MTIALHRSGLLVSLVGQLPAEQGDADSYMAALHGIAAQPGPFLLLVDIGIDLYLTPEQRKAQNLWYKTNRSRIEASCRACAMVRAAADEEMQRIWRGLFNFPLLVTRSREEADRFLEDHAAEARHVRAG